MRGSASDAAAEPYYVEAERLEREGWASEEPQPQALARFLAERERKIPEAVRLAEEAAGQRRDIHTMDALAWAYFKAGRLSEALDRRGRRHPDGDARSADPLPRRGDQVGQRRPAGGTRAPRPVVCARRAARCAGLGSRALVAGRDASGVERGRRSGRTLMRRALVLASVLLLVSAPAPASELGTIAGVVRDVTGLVLPGATVTIRDATAQVVATATTDAAGTHRTNLRPVSTRWRSRS